jgi:ABC-type transport system substrate-binding protein
VVVKEEVIKEVMVPGETVIVEKEVVKTVEVPGKTVVVKEEVVREVVRGASEGEIVMVLAGPMPSVSGWTSNCGGVCYWATLMNVTETLLHGGRDANGLPNYRGKVVDSWEYAPDFSYIDWQVKSGNYFHQGFGEVTAHDVVYTYNEGDPRFASDETKALVEASGAGAVIHRGLPEPFMGKLELLDDFNFRMPLLFGRPEVNGLFQFTDDSYPVGIHSKRAFDEMGWEWVRDNIIGSGPYEYEELDSDVRWSMIARTDPENEDEKIPFVYRWSVLNIPDFNVRLGMYSTKQAHRAWLDESTEASIELLNQGHSKIAPNGGKSSGIFTWMGNYWETVDAQTGEVLEREARGQIGNGGDEYPWICGPGPDPLMPEVSDCNNVAKKFRAALFMSIDRRTLLDALYSGWGKTTLSPVNTDDPFVQKHGDRWGDPYNTMAAKALFAEWKTEYEAMGGDFDKVLVSAWIGTQGRKEITEAILSHWEELFGIRWEMDNTPQSSWSPGAWRGREGWQLVRDTSLTFRGNSMLWDVERWHTSLGQPTSRNAGFEMLKATETILAKSEAWNDSAKQEQLTLDWMDWFYDQHISVGAFEAQNVHDLYRSDHIESWTSRVPGVPWILWDPEYVTLRK